MPAMIQKRTRRQLGLRVAGAVLLAVSACIHLALYLTGYRSIPTIGWLFLLQVIVGFVLVAGALVTYSRLAAAAGAAFALSTLGCYLLANRDHADARHGRAARSSGYRRPDQLWLRSGQEAADSGRLP